MQISRLFYVTVVLALLIVSACAPFPSSSPLPVINTQTSEPSILPTPTAAITVTTTLDAFITLPHRTSWVATPSIPEKQVSEVDFLIDNQLAFVEKHSPYTYGRDGNYLVTSFLTAGQHSFTVRVLAIGGQGAESTVKAAVDTAPNHPDGLANTFWMRSVTDEDVKKATSSELPPTGQWELTISSMGWSIHDPLGGGLNFDLEYQSAEHVELRSTIETPPYPNTTNGAFCEETDPPFLWSYAITNDGKTLTLHPVGNDLCGDRVAILEGT